jgi:hypothetical protein
VIAFSTFSEFANGFGEQDFGGMVNGQNLNRFHIFDPINDPVIFMDYFPDALVVYLRNNPAQVWKVF